MAEKVEKRGQVYRSMSDFEREFLPKSFENRKTEKTKDVEALGIILANESLQKIKECLTRK